MTDTITSRLIMDALKQRAKMSEGLTKSELAGAVRIDCLYQRPMKYGRAQKPVVEALCWRWLAVPVDQDCEETGPAVSLVSEADILALLDGEPLERVQQRMRERANVPDLFNAVRRNRDGA